jgi:hypothetical protein
MIHRGILEDCKFNYKIIEEEQGVCLDREMCRGILEAQRVVDNNIDAKGP